MNYHFKNADYKIRLTIQTLNYFMSENAGSVEELNAEIMDNVIGNLKEAKESIVNSQRGIE